MANHVRPLSGHGLKVWILLACLVAVPSWAGVGDPQIRTDHPWYPGEGAFSTFERLFAAQADLYQHVVGKRPQTDEDRVLASWLWRNTHYWHGEEGAEDLWGQGFQQGPDGRTREYWTGLFAHGFGLCGTTHSQWTAEMEYLLGHGRGRGVGVEGHNSFEVFLKGGSYAEGKWALLDHDISTVIFNAQGTQLLSIEEVKGDLKRLTDRDFAPQRQRGWLVAGLHPADAAGVYGRFDVAEYLAGYAGPGPMVHLRRGETLRRYLAPGLEDGKTFVFWGRNYATGGIPGPERSRTWVNQPEKMHGSSRGTPHVDGQVRYANAQYTYRPDFSTPDYREGVISEDDLHITFEFYTPYIIGATPANNEPWGIYDSGGKNGLVLHGKAKCPVALSVDQGATWKECGDFADGMDLTDHVKGFRQYFIRFGAGAKGLAASGLTMTTVCQASTAVLPRLKADGSVMTFATTQRGVVSAGPTLPQARAHRVEGDFGTPHLVLELAAPRREPVLALHAAAHLASGSPPDPTLRSRIEYSTDGGKTWLDLVKEWDIPRQGQQPADFWSQSFCYGGVELASAAPGPVRVRFSNNRGKSFMRAEAHLVYQVSGRDGTKVTFDWTDDAGKHWASHIFPGDEKTSTMKLDTGKNPRTHYVEFEPSWPGSERPD